MSANTLATFAFIDQRIDEILKRPGMWGPPIAVEMQVLTLLDVRSCMSTGFETDPRARIVAWTTHMNDMKVDGPNTMCLTDRLGLTTLFSERFVEVLRVFVEQQRERDDP